MPFLTTSQQHQSTEGSKVILVVATLSGAVTVVATVVIHILLPVLVVKMMTQHKLLMACI